MNHEKNNNIQVHLEKIKDLRTSGVSVAKMAEIYGYTRVGMWRLLRNLKIGRNDNKYKKREKFIDPKLRLQQRRLTRKACQCRTEGIPFEIEFKDLDFPEICPVLGIALDYSITPSCRDTMPSFDRLDPTKGYVKGNVFIISMKANRLKSNATIEDLEKILAYMEASEDSLENFLCREA